MKSRTNEEKGSFLSSGGGRKSLRRRPKGEAKEGGKAKAGEKEWPRQRTRGEKEPVSRGYSSLGGKWKGVEKRSGKTDAFGLFFTFQSQNGRTRGRGVRKAFLGIIDVVVVVVVVAR